MTCGSPHRTWTQPHARQYVPCPAATATAASTAARRRAPQSRPPGVRPAAARQPPGRQAWLAALCFPSHGAPRLGPSCFGRTAAPPHRTRPCSAARVAPGVGVFWRGASHTFRALAFPKPHPTCFKGGASGWGPPRSPAAPRRGWTRRGRRRDCQCGSADPCPVLLRPLYPYIRPCCVSVLCRPVSLALCARLYPPLPPLTSPSAHLHIPAVRLTPTKAPTARGPRIRGGGADSAAWRTPGAPSWCEKSVMPSTRDSRTWGGAVIGECAQAGRAGALTAGARGSAPHARGGREGEDLTELPAEAHPTLLRRLGPCEGAAFTYTGGGDVIYS